MHRLIIPALLWSSTALAAGQPWLGLHLGDGGSFGGVRVRDVVEGSPAKRAGVVAGDEVLAIDDVPTMSASGVIAEVQKAGLGAQVKVRLADGKGHTRLLAITLEPKPNSGELQRRALVGKPAPDFEPLVQAGAKLPKLSSLKGQVVLIDFFATWCGPCRESAPHIEKLYERLGGKGLRVIGVSTEPPAVVAGAAGAWGLKYTLASDENEGISASYRVFALPTMIVIDRKGVVREVAINDTDAVDAAVEAALKVK